jgi:hypothetical protein
MQTRSFECVFAGTGSMGAWRGVAMDSQKFQPGPSFYILRVDQPLKRSCGCFRAGGLRPSSSILDTPCPTPFASDWLQCCNCSCTIFITYPGSNCVPICILHFFFYYFPFSFSISLSFSFRCFQSRPPRSSCVASLFVETNKSCFMVTSAIYLRARRYPYFGM